MAKIAAALPEMDLAQRIPIIRSIVAREIDESRASRVTDEELQGWHMEDVKAILDQLSPPLNLLGSKEPCGPRFNQLQGMSISMRLLLYGMRSTAILWLIPIQLGATMYLICKGRSSAIWKEVPAPTLDMMSWCSEYFTFIKAPIRLIVSSTEQKKALCVDRRGNFRLMDSGYSVMSHSWAETMGWSTTTSWGPTELAVRKEGLPLDQLQRIFDHCKVEWLWLDLVAMPEVLEDMSETDKDKTEAIRCDVINCLHKIYSDADAVIIIDSLLLRLHSGSIVDAAVMLCLSRWMTRLWPLAEARLAKRVHIRTGDHTFDLDDMIRFFAELIANNQHRYFHIVERLEPLRPTPPGGERVTYYTAEEHSKKRVHILNDVRYGSSCRSSNVEIDHVRAIFPILNLQWQHSWTVRDGFRHLVAQFPDRQETIQSYFRHRQDHLQWCTWDSIVEQQ